MSAAVWTGEPRDVDRTLAAVTDEQLAEDLREAITAIGYMFDAWWPDARMGAHRRTVERAEMIETMRTEVALLGASATLGQLAATVQPLLGDFMETPDLRAAVDVARDVTMHRWTLIRYMRESIARWDAEHPR